MKTIIATTIIMLGIIGGAIIISRGSYTDTNIPANNISIVDGKQIVDIRAKGGYQPRKSLAKAGIPTILRIETNNTFDCSSSIRIPSLSIRKNLPSSGSTDFDLGSPKVGILQGSCGMGMYPFEIEFQGS